ncbi:glycosyltransferase family 9 protein [Magnetovibrio sp. PR-2]|uniref:glycosyltransferase family 9 protein n=1 Tax=Magnetovibrio sp. PR-2 TaxID=3120356 RepID=UPI002FCE4974
MASLQHVEKLFGTLVCGLLHGPAKLIPKPRDMDPDHVKKVLVVKFFGIGSLVIATPFFAEARKRFPNAQIHLLTLSSNRPVMGMIEDVDQVHYVDLGNNLFSAVLAYVGTLWRTYWGRFDVLIDMEFYTRASAVVSLASWSPVRIGYHAAGIYRGGLQNHRVTFNSYWHVTKNFMSLLEPYGYDHSDDDVLPHLTIPDGLSEQAQAVIDNVGPRYIVVNVNAGELAFERRWYPKRFAELGQKLSQHYELPCVFIGAPSERAYVDAVVAQVLELGGRAVNTAGELDLCSMAQICREARLVISNDSGPLHVAAATGTPVVGFFGPETPTLYGPSGSGHLVFHENLSCSPCINIEQGKRLKCIHETTLCQEATTADFAFKAIQAKYETLLKV